MSCEQVKDVLSNTRQLHQSASVLFSQMATACSNQRTELLLNYLSEHENSLADAIDKIKNDSSPLQLNTWLQSCDLGTALDLCRELNTDPTVEASFEELIELALNIDEHVVKLYSELAEKSEPVWVQELFQNLLEMEQAEEKLVAKQSLRGMDL